MDVEFDTVVVAVDTQLDDRSRAHSAEHKPARPGAAAVMSDGAVLTLSVVGQALGLGERAVVRRAAREWRSPPPRQRPAAASSRPGVS